ncbi:hypothetical protein WA026_015691 [Henosepilachna vigintioctopunctata]|uniref:DRBM domain-containing protein n=1 Tax=Henosepilachna vigintioctopunctata TaxID=420089 RepID=A0AAW1UUL0_9CUCU
MDISDTNEDADGPIPWQQVASFAIHKLLVACRVDPTQIAVKEEHPTRNELRPAKKLPENAASLNPLMVVNQMLPQAQYEEVSKVGMPHNCSYTIKCTVDNQQFTGTSGTKKMARKIAAYAVCMKLLGIDRESPNRFHKQENCWNKHTTRRGTSNQNIGNIESRRPVVTDNFVSGGQLTPQKGGIQQGPPQAGFNTQEQNNTQQQVVQQQQPQLPPEQQQLPPQQQSTQQILPQQQQQQVVQPQQQPQIAPNPEDGMENCAEVTVEGEKRKWPRSKIPKKEKMRRQPDLPVDFVRVEGYLYKATVLVEEIPYSGFGRSKVGAENAAAEVAIKYSIKNKLIAQFGSTDGDSEKMDISDTNEDADGPIPWHQVASFAIHKLLVACRVDPTQIAVKEEHPTPNELRPAKKLPENAASLNPLMVVNQMLPQAQYEEVSKVGMPHNCSYTIKCTVDNQQFTGTSGTKKMARKIAAYAVCMKLLGIEYPPEAKENCWNKHTTRRGTSNQNIGNIESRRPVVTDYFVSGEQLTPQKGGIQQGQQQAEFNTQEQNNTQQQVVQQQQQQLPPEQQQLPPQQQSTKQILPQQQQQQVVQPQQQPQIAPKPEDGMENCAEVTVEGGTRKSPRSKIPKKKKMRRRNQRLIKLLQPKNALMILNELATVSVEEIPYSGFGRSKVGAKNAAAEVAIKYLIKDKLIAQFGSTDSDSEKMDISDTNEDADGPIPWQQVASFAIHKLLVACRVDPTQIAVKEEHPTPNELRPAKKLPENAASLNPLMVVNQMSPQAQYEEVSQVGMPHNCSYTIKCTVDNQQYTGTSGTKKMARKIAAYAVCMKLLGIEYPPEAKENCWNNHTTRRGTSNQNIENIESRRPVVTDNFVSGGQLTPQKGGIQQGQPQAGFNTQEQNNTQQQDVQQQQQQLPPEQQQLPPQQQFTQQILPQQQQQQVVQPQQQPQIAPKPEDGTENCAEVTVEGDKRKWPRSKIPKKQKMRRRNQRLIKLL